MLSIPFLYVYKSLKLNLESGRAKGLLEGFKKTKRIYILDHFLFLLRRQILILVIIFRWNHGVQQAIIVLAWWFIVLAWKIIVRPFNRAILNFQDTLFEFLLLILFVIYLRFGHQKSEFDTKGTFHTLGIAWITIMGSMIIINTVITIYINCKSKRFLIKLFKHLFSTS